MATNSSILAWRIPWTEEPGGLQSMWSQRVMTQPKRLGKHAQSQRTSRPKLLGATESRNRQKIICFQIIMFRHLTLHR